MGVTFRSGDYIRFVRLGGRTIKDGEAAAIWNRRGEHQQIIGPKRVVLFYSTIRFLSRYKAQPNQYLTVKYRDGTVKHIRGPASMYLNPSLHDDIVLKDGILLKENDVIQVCRISTVDNKMSNSKAPLAEQSKRLVHGPTLFVPAEDESVEVFCWGILPGTLGETGTNNSDATESSFSVVKIHTSHIWNVKVPLGSGSGRVYASFAISYKINSIEKAASHKDPLGSLCAALMLGVQGSLPDEPPAAESSTRYFQSIQATVTKNLSNQESFRKLYDAAETSGFCIETAKLVKVSPGEQLREEIHQEHQSALRTKMDVENKKRQIHFQELELEEQQKKIEHDDALARKSAKMQADLAEEVFNQKMKARTREDELAKMEEERELQRWKASDQVVLEFLGGLKGLGVDMSAFLCTDDGKKATAGTLKHAPSLAGTHIGEAGAIPCAK